MNASGQNYSTCTARYLRQ